jgi:hypothetical protein
MDKIEKFRQFISPFISGPNADALIGTLADQAERQEQLSIAVTDQLTISTASQEFLEKRLSEVGIIQPADLGMSDDALRSLGITVTSAKQVTEVIHSVLDVFYGAAAVRAHVQCTQPEPYILQDGMDLILSFEDDEPIAIVLNDSDFSNINQATAQEVADAITRKIREYGRAAFASVHTDFATNEKYVKIFGAAKGPYSLVRVLGGQVQNILEFPTIRPTRLLANTTVWQVTRTVGDTLRFRWMSGPSPLLDQIVVGDKVMIYGDDFENYNLTGTFDVINVRLPNLSPAYNAGWFEIQLTNSGLRNSTPDQAPPANNPPVYYSYSITQTSFDDLKFFFAQKNVPYNQTRYALAFEPANNLLQIFLPVTTQVIQRDLIGAGHMHLLYPNTIFDGSFGSLMNHFDKIQIINSRSIKYRQNGLDVDGAGGLMTYGATTKEIESAARENGYTTIVTTTEHGITGDSEWSIGSDYVVDDVVWNTGMNWKAIQNSGPSYGGAYEPILDSTKWQILGPGINYSSEIVSVLVDQVWEDDPYNAFNGSYVWDLSTQYTLTDQMVITREQIYAGENRRTLLTDGHLQSKTGVLLMDLGKDTQEGPIPFLDIQLQNAPIAVSISSISQNGFQMTVITAYPHGAVPGSTVIISGTTFFNGTYTVNSVPSPNIYTAVSPISQIQSETTGTSTVMVADVVSTLIVDPSYIFKYTHEINSDLTLLSSTGPYIPTPDGADYSLYVTGTANATVFAEQIINNITALGINMEITLLFPNDLGLGNQGGSASTDDPPTSDKVWIWSEI